MKSKFFYVLLIVCNLTGLSFAQSNCPQDAPRQLVEKLWASAAKGELLTSDGFSKVSALFTKGSALPENATIHIVSDYYGVNEYTLNGSNAVVDMEFVDAGEIDERFRYSEPKRHPGIKTSVRYYLVSGAAYASTYGPDGKTVVGKKEIPGLAAWRIEGSPPNPWTTVNGAIRYLLEARSKTDDADVKKNADDSITRLLRLH